MGVLIPKDELRRINRRLRELADGYIRVVKVDGEEGKVWIELVGGRLC